MAPFRFRNETFSFAAILMLILTILPGVFGVDTYHNRLLPSRPKIAITDQATYYYSIIIHPDHRIGSPELKRLLRAMEAIAVPPRKHNVYEVKSKWMGTWMVVVAFPLTQNIPEIIDRLRCKAVLNHAFTPSEDAAGHPELPRWIDPDAIEGKKSPKRPLDQDPDGETQARIIKPTIDLANQTSQSFKPRGRPYERRDTGGSSRTAKKSASGLGDDMEGLDVSRLQGRAALPEFRMISQPPDVNPFSQMTDAYIDREGGKGVLVYVADTGFDWSHREFSVRGEKTVRSWLFTGPMPKDEKGDNIDPSDSDTYSGVQYTPQGTWVASKIVGKRVGVAPRAELVVVRIVSGENAFLVSCQLEYILKIYDHWRETEANDNGIKGAVVVQAFE
ncbi:hypothetical protein TWF481_008133 [Arthrobotrys musiformis]|uniref:Peptidase S8/S53 domain-containing protein n=1 Tax=Arthrobotrys musiformis TaxID=47236 RepID=A0AAV9WC02_9PEZI